MTSSTLVSINLFPQVVNDIIIDYLLKPRSYYRNHMSFLFHMVEVRHQYWLNDGAEQDEKFDYLTGNIQPLFAVYEANESSESSSHYNYWDDHEQN